MIGQLIVFNDRYRKVNIFCNLNLKKNNKLKYKSSDILYNKNVINLAVIKSVILISKNL